MTKPMETEEKAPRIRRKIRHRQMALDVGREPALLVGGYLPGQVLDGEKPLEELELLAQTAGAITVGKIVQNLKEIHPGTYIGTGKVDEVKALVKQTKAECVIFDQDLTPSQGWALNKRIGIKVIDRTDLILDIFSAHAKTRMAKVQVNLALNEHRLPRLRRLWTHLERQTGGIGVRGGPGERQIETDRRKVLKTIHDLKAELKLIESRKERTVKARSQEHYLVSLAGYTNAGKSTLMRALTGEEVYIEDKLFATLDTKTSTLGLKGGIKVLLSDTVGFIRRLPHHLVASFHATLEETRMADLLLHVVDASSPLARAQIKAVEEVLNQTGCEGKETILVFNKMDRVKDEQALAIKLIAREFPSAVTLSALTGEGLDNLKALIFEKAKANAQALTVSVHAGEGSTLAFLATHFFEEERICEGEWITLRGRASPAVLDRLWAAGPRVKVLGALGKDDHWGGDQKKPWTVTLPKDLP